MKKILIIVLLLIAAGVGVSVYAAETQKNSTNSNNTIVQKKENTADIKENTNTSKIQENDSKSVNSSNNTVDNTNSKVNSTNIDSSSNVNDSKDQNSNTKDLSQNNNTNSSTNDEYIIKEKIYINKFAWYNGDFIRLYGSLLPKPIPLGVSATYDSLSGPKVPIYIKYKYLVKHNNSIQTWYMIHYRISLHSMATAYIESNDLFSNLSDVGDKNLCPDVDLKNGINIYTGIDGR